MTDAHYILNKYLLKELWGEIKDKEGPLLYLKDSGQTSSSIVLLVMNNTDSLFK